MVRAARRDVVTPSPTPRAARRYKQFFVDLMMAQELNLQEPVSGAPIFGFMAALGYFVGGVCAAAVHAVWHLGSRQHQLAVFGTAAALVVVTLWMMRSSAKLRPTIHVWAIALTTCTSVAAVAATHTLAPLVQQFMTPVLAAFLAAQRSA